MINDRLDRLNDDRVDPHLLDRTLEFGEALDNLDNLDKHKGVITSKGCSFEDYIQEGFQEYLENEEAVIAEAEKMAPCVEEYEKWAESMHTKDLDLTRR